jgi:hypothetical protein
MDKALSTGLLLLVAILLLAACGTTATVSPLATPALESPLATPGQGGIQPASAATCSDSAKVLQDVLGTAGTAAEVPFEDYITGQSGTGCQVTVTGTGADFGTMDKVDQPLWAAMEAAGWTRDTTYEAGIATGSVSGWRKGNELCLLGVSWKPSADANCPQDQPISACNVKPEQQLYTITLNCATVSQ